MATTETKSDDSTFPLWVDELYNVEKIQKEDLYNWYEVYQYKGFNRNEVLRSLRAKVPDFPTCQQIILVCALKGPQRAALTTLVNGKTIQSYGIPASGMKGSKGVSCQRITAATADLAAFFLKQLNVPKRIPIDCPAWLQFPAAGSITMSNELRVMHIEFSKRFSTVIGGVFNEQIYQTMINNSYYDNRLRLFHNDPEPQQIVTIPVVAPTFNPNRGSVGATKTTASNKQ